MGKIIVVDVIRNSFSEKQIRYIFSKKLFTKIKTKFAQFDGYCSISDLKNEINNIQTIEKQSTGVLPGIFKKTLKTTKNKAYQNTSPHTSDLEARGCFLAFDYDSKDNEGRNHDLFFEQIKKIAVISYRSFSGTGVAGFFFVKGLEKFSTDTEYNRCVHRDHYAKAVYQRIEAEFGVKLDYSQGKLRQARYIAKNTNTVELNPKFIVFEVPKFYPVISVIPYKKHIKTPNTTNVCEKTVNRAVESAKSMISTAANGTKHETLAKASKLLGGYLNTGLISRYEATQVLINEISKRNIRSLDSAKKNIESGLRYGERYPKTKDEIIREYTVYINSKH